MLVLVTFIIGCIDQAAKLWLTASGESYDVNEGVAFGIGGPQLTFIGLIFFIVVGAIVKFQPRLYWLSLGLAIGFNLIDRVRVGGVIDYLSFGPWQLNLTDLLISGLTILLVWQLYRSQHATHQ